MPFATTAKLSTAGNLLVSSNFRPLLLLSYRTNYALLVDLSFIREFVFSSLQRVLSMAKLWISSPRISFIASINTATMFSLAYSERSSFLMITFVDQLVQYLYLFYIYFMISPLIPFWRSLKIRPSCHTLSKAFEISRNIPWTSSPASNAFKISWLIDCCKTQRSKFWLAWRKDVIIKKEIIHNVINLAFKYLTAYR